MHEIKIKYLDSSAIEKKAQLFLRKYHSSGNLPIPIEEIIEFKLGSNIITLPGLQSTANRAGLDVDAFYSHKDNSITVDEFVWKKREHRYRFSLAHEVGHRVLHEYIYRDIHFVNTEEYMNFINDMSEQMLRWAEWQANEFAGRVLMPTQFLDSSLNEAIESLEQEIEITFRENPEEVALYAIRYYLVDLYNVSEEALKIRLGKEGLIPEKLFREKSSDDCPF